MTSSIDIEYREWKREQHRKRWRERRIRIYKTAAGWSVFMAVLWEVLQGMI